MTLQYSDALIEAMLAELNTSIGGTGTLEIRTGAPPADCATADSGTVLATISLPASPFATPSGAAVAKNGTWEDTSADADGTAGHFRIKNGATCHVQGTCGDVGTEDLVLDNAVIATGQQVTITAFTITGGNQ